MHNKRLLIIGIIAAAIVVVGIVLALLLTPVTTFLFGGTGDDFRNAGTCTARRAEEKPIESDAPIVVVTPAPVVVAPQPQVVVQTPPPVVATGHYETRVQNVWVEGRYVDQTTPQGAIVRTWQPGHYEQQQTQVWVTP